MELVTSAGYGGPKVFIIKNNKMEKGKMDWYPIRGLGPTSVMENTLGYLVIMNTRNLDDKFFFKWNLDVLTPFIERTRLNFFSEDTQLNTDASITCDGEYSQVYLPTHSQEVIDALDNAKASQIKVPASSTDKLQDLDAGKRFSSSIYVSKCTKFF